MTAPLTFTVTINRMVESHIGTSYLVAIIRSDRKPDARIWDEEGVITPFQHSKLEYVVAEARVWAEFLNATLKLPDYALVQEVKPAV